MSAQPTPTEDSRGLTAAAVGFLIWGIVPIYWRQMKSVAAVELIAHRIVWSLAFLAAIVLWQRSFPKIRAALTDWASVRRNLLSASLLSINWLTYVWAVNNDRIIESSLGYFLTPLANVAMGYLVLHEHLRRMQWTAIALAVAGVAVLLVAYGQVPWVALTLAGSWGCYAIMRKRSPLGSVAGLAVETTLLFPVAAGFLAYLALNDRGALGQVDARTTFFVLSVGVITAVPLLLFAYGAQRIRLVTIGLLQYIAPTAQFLIGLLIYREPFDRTQLGAYSLIWTGLVLYTLDSVWNQRRRKRD